MPVWEAGVNGKGQVERIIPLPFYASIDAASATARGMVYVLIRRHTKAKNQSVFSTYSTQGLSWSCSKIAP